jgi:transposase-like protein/ribosomal protein L37AE/L43A
MNEDYPRTLAELSRRFGSEEACTSYLAQRRWPEGFCCPHCQGADPWRMGRGLWLCRQCRKQVSVKSGTVFADSRLPLTDWFRAMWHVTSQKNGASALGLQRVMGWGSYETAWTCLHKLRRAMVRPGRDRLRGLVEMDETYVGGERPGKRGRGAAGKCLVVIAAEVLESKGIGRIRLLRVPNAAAASLTPAVQALVEPGSVIRTDDWNGYVGLASASYPREVIGPEAVESGNRLPCCHRVASLLKRWLLGTHQGAVRPKQLDYYLDEFTFRFNRRTSTSRGKLFYRLAQQAVQIEPHPYVRIVRPRPQPVGVG